MNANDFQKNIAYLDENDICLVSKNVWPDKIWSVELEMYTDAGEDMLIDLEEPTKECLQEYIDDFDINENVVLWWRNGEEAAHKKGVPFSNICEHYKDYESFLSNLQDVCDKWE